MQAQVPPSTPCPSTPSVVLVAGKPPRPGTLVHDVADRLRAAGVQVGVVLPHQDPAALDRLGQASDRPDLLLHRGLRADALAGVARIQAAGLACCNDAGAAALTVDRAGWTDRLSTAGVPVPRSWTTPRWSEVEAASAVGPVVLKRADGATGRAAGVALLPGPCDPPFPGPWLVQDPVPGDGVDRKLYVCGDRVDGLLKPGPLGGGTAAVRSFEPEAVLVDLARAVGAVLGLHLYGVDVLLGPDGPVVVDVNAMPGYRGVVGAADHVTDHVVAHLRPGGGRRLPSPG